MARAKLKADDTEEYKGPDIERALKIWTNDIAPAKSKAGTHSQRAGEGYKLIAKECRIPKKILDFVMYLDDAEDHKRDHELRCLHGLLQAKRIYMPSDLIDQAEGHGAADSPLPTGERERPRLVTVSNGTETDLADAAEGEEQWPDDAQIESREEVAEAAE